MGRRIHLSFGDYTLEVEYSYSPGSPGSFHEPPEGPEIIPEKFTVFWMEGEEEREVEIPLAFLFGFNLDFEEELMRTIERNEREMKELF